MGMPPDPYRFAAQQFAARAARDVPTASAAPAKAEVLSASQVSNITWEEAKSPATVATGEVKTQLSMPEDLAQRELICLAKAKLAADESVPSTAVPSHAATASSISQVQEASDTKHQLTLKLDELEHLHGLAEDNTYLRAEVSTMRSLVEQASDQTDKLKHGRSWVTPRAAKQPLSGHRSMSSK